MIPGLLPGDRVEPLPTVIAPLTVPMPLKSLTAGQREPAADTGGHRGWKSAVNLILGDVEILLVPTVERATVPLLTVVAPVKE